MGEQSKTVEQVRRENEVLGRLVMWFVRRERIRLDANSYKRNLHGIAKEIEVDPQELGNLVAPLMQRLFDRTLGRGTGSGR